MVVKRMVQTNQKYSKVLYNAKEKLTKDANCKDTDGDFDSSAPGSTMEHQIINAADALKDAKENSVLKSENKSGGGKKKQRWFNADVFLIRGEKI